MRAHRHHLSLAAGLVLTGGLVAGCTAVSGGYVAPVVVTVTPTVTVTPKAPAAASAAPSTPVADIQSDDEGKKFDLGRISDIRDEQGVKVIELDRYQSTTVPFAKVQDEGLDWNPHSREIFRNPSSQKYSLPVRPGAQLQKLTCTSVDAPVQSSPATLEELQGLARRDGVLLLSLDDKGWVVSAKSDPVCH